MVQVVKSDWPVSYYIWATAVYIYNTLVRKKVPRNCRKCVDFCVKFAWLTVLVVVVFLNYL